MKLTSGSGRTLSLCCWQLQNVRCFLYHDSNNQNENGLFEVILNCAYDNDTSVYLHINVIVDDYPIMKNYLFNVNMPWT